MKYVTSHPLTPAELEWLEQQRKKVAQRALDHPIARQRLEGLEVTPETVALLEQVT